MADQPESNADQPESNEERPCLHCLVADVIDDFYAEYGAASGEKDMMDMDEIISALAKTIAELTIGYSAVERKRDAGDHAFRGGVRQHAGLGRAPLSG